jgi:hypothetical protein
MNTVLVYGKCRVCGCSELQPCLLDSEPGTPIGFCHWMDRAKTLCSNVDCIAQIRLDELEKMLEETRA